MSKAKTKTKLKIAQSVYYNLPAFTDIFDEDTFYIFVFFFVLSTILLVMILSRFITIKPVD